MFNIPPELIIINLINFTSHTILFCTNNINKTLQKELLKTTTYFITYTANITTYTLLINTTLPVYSTITGVLFFTHYILDTELLFRFNKALNYTIMLFISLTVYTLYFFTL